ncbi:hypothetical protein XENOCAPTIV_015815, partial [Xenoophorus captivus]
PTSSMLQYIHPLRQIFNKFQSISDNIYAVDILQYSSLKNSEFFKLYEILECVKEITNWLKTNSLQLHSKKTKCLIIAPDSLVPLIRQQIGHLNSAVKPNFRNLGVF